MTAAAVPADIVPPRPAWRSLLWIAPVTVLWIVLIYWQPAISTSGAPTSAHQLMAHGLIAVGLWLGLESTDLTPGQRRTTWLAVMIPDTLWFAVAWSAAINGVLRPGASPLPLLPMATSARRCCCCRSGWGRCSIRCRRAGSSLFSFTAYSAAGLSLPGCAGRCPACSPCRRELAIC
jgi:hypothetical protein